jgi:beta-lactamase regulating signal transducer with metallopeptidase domain
MLAGTLALAIVLALRPFARRWVGAQVAYRMWLLVPVAAVGILLPAPTRPMLAMLHVPSTPATTLLTSLTTNAAQTLPMFDFRFWLLTIWILGALATLVFFLMQQRRYLKNLGALAATDSGELRAESSHGSPALVGALRPRIVLPHDFDRRYTPHERELVLAHERTHLRRGDAQVNALVVLIRCVNWFNPLIHFAASRFRFDQELACDALVIARFPSARRPYADALLKVQLMQEVQRELPLPAGCYWPSSHPLKERIAMLKLPPLSARRRVIASFVIALITLGAGYTSWAAQEPKTAHAEEGAMFKIEGKFFVGDHEIMDSAGLVGAENWPLITATGDTPDSFWKLSFTIRPFQSDTKHVDLKIEHLGASIVILDATATLNQPVDIFTQAVFDAASAKSQTGVKLMFRGTITPVDQVAMCKQMIEERRSQTLHAFDAKIPSDRTMIGGGNMEIRGERMHVLLPEPETLEFATIKDGFVIDPVRIRAADSPGQKVTLQIERFQGKDSVSSETRTVAFGEPVQVELPSEIVSFTMQPLLPQDLIPLSCRSAAVASLRTN